MDSVNFSKISPNAVNEVYVEVYTVLYASIKNYGSFIVSEENQTYLGWIWLLSQKSFMKNLNSENYKAL